MSFGSLAECWDNFQLGPSWIVPRLAVPCLGWPRGGTAGLLQSCSSEAAPQSTSCTCAEDWDEQQGGVFPIVSQGLLPGEWSGVKDENNTNLHTGEGTMGNFVKF